MTEAIGLVPKKDAQSKTLSGGMKRKLSVAMALVGGSKVTILFVFNLSHSKSFYNVFNRVQFIMHVCISDSSDTQKGMDNAPRCFVSLLCVRVVFQMKRHFFIRFTYDDE